MPWQTDRSTGSAGTDCAFRDEVTLEDLSVVNVSVVSAPGCNIDSGFLSLGHAKADEPSGANFLTAIVSQGLIATEPSVSGCLDGKDT